MQLFQRHDLNFKTASRNLLVVVLYVLLAKIGLYFALKPTTITIFWPAGGFALAVLLFGGLKYLPGIFIAGMIAGFMVMDNLWLVTALSTANMLESFSAYWLLSNYFSFNPSLKTRQDFFNLALLAAGISSAISALIGSTALLFGNIIPLSLYPTICFRWWMGDVLGIAFVTPLILIWKNPPQTLTSKLNALEMLAIYVSILLVGQILFFDWLTGSDYDTQSVSWLILLIIWAGLRSGRHTTSALQLIIFIEALWSASHGVGHYANDMVKSGLFDFWLFGMFLAVGGMAIAVMTDENRKIQDILRTTEIYQRALLDNFPFAVWLKDTESRFLVVNKGFASIFDVQNVAELVGKNDFDIAPSDLAESYRKDDRSVLATRQAKNIEEEAFTRGERKWFETYKAPVFDNNGLILGTVGFARDITERKQMEDALRKSEQLWKFAIEGSGDGVWDWNIQTDKVMYSKRWKEMLGYAEGDILPTNQEWLTRIHHDDRSYVAGTMQAYLDGETAIYVVEYRLKCKDDSYKWILGRGMVVSHSEDDKPLRMIGTHTDISMHKQAEEELRIAATVFESQEGMMVTDVNNNILRVNSAFTHITGYSAEDVVAKNPRILQSGHHDANFYAAMWEGINSTGTWHGEVWNQRKNGEIYPEHLIITAVKDQNSIISNYVATLTDITLRKEAVDKIEQLAFYDPLTGLPNRRLLQDRLKPALASSHRSGLQGALLFIDMDNFKTLNDTLGHDMGDLLLQQVAQRLESCMREGDTVARLGGDEFVVMLEDLSEQTLEAATQTEVIGNKILTILNLPYQLAMHEYRSTPSIGAALFNGQEQSSDELLKQADIAMYQAKASGRNALRFFDPQMQASITARVAMEEDLRLALAENQFMLYYQPQVNSSSQIIGAEVLIRWHHPQRGLVSPIDFIPLAEENGLILPIGLWVLDTACAQLKKWEGSEQAKHLQLAVNVSARQFHQTEFVGQVSQILSSTAISPSKLKLELTESLVLKNIDEAIFKMNEIREMGVNFSMDDFGTGYSSLSNLKKLPFNQLKIDQSFVRDIANDPDDVVIVQTIISMGKNLGMNVIAEGVETEVQRAFLEQHGCSLYQGYLFSKPVPIEVFESLLKPI